MFMLEIIFNGKFQGAETALGIGVAFGIAFVGMSIFKGRLPRDRGGKCAHNGAL